MTPNIWTHKHLPRFIPRPDMPQIGPGQLPDLLRFIRAQGVAVHRETDKPNELTRRQRVLFDPRLFDRRDLRRPVLVSNDGVILDGNHRDEAHRLNGTIVPVERIDLPFRKAAQLLLKYPGVTLGKPERR